MLTAALKQKQRKEIKSTIKVKKKFIDSPTSLQSNLLTAALKPIKVVDIPSSMFTFVMMLF